MSRQRSNAGGVFLGILSFILVAIIAIGVCYATIPRFKNWVNDTLKIEKTADADSSNKDEIIENLKAQLAQKEAAEQKNKAELQETQNKLSEAQKEAEANAQKIKSLETQLSSAESTLQQKESEVSRLEGELTTKTQELSEANTAKSNLETQLSAAQQTITEKESRISELTSSGEENQAEIERLQGELQSEQEKANGLQSQLTTKTQEVETLNGQIDSLTQEKTRLDSELEQAKSEVEQLKQEKSSLESTIEENNGKITQLTQKVSELETALNGEDEERKYLYHLAVNYETLKRLDVSDSECLLISSIVAGVYYVDMGAKTIHKLYGSGIFDKTYSTYERHFITKDKNVLLVSDEEIVFYDNVKKSVSQVYSGDCTNITDIRYAAENSKGNIIFPGSTSCCHFDSTKKNVTILNGGRMNHGIALKNDDFLYSSGAKIYRIEEDSLTASIAYNPSTKVTSWGSFKSLEKTGDVLIFCNDPMYQTDNVIIYNCTNNRFELRTLSYVPNVIVELSNGDALLSSSYSSSKGLIRYNRAIQNFQSITFKSETINGYNFTNVLELDRKILVSSGSGSSSGVFVIDGNVAEKQPITSGYNYKFTLLDNEKIFVACENGRGVRYKIYLLDSSFNIEEMSGDTSRSMSVIAKLKMSDGNLFMVISQDGTSSDLLYLYDVGENKFEQIYNMGVGFLNEFGSDTFFDILEEDEFGVHIKSSNPKVTYEYYYKFEDKTCSKIDNSN